MKQRKKQYYSNYFKNNIKNMKNTWKGIKSIISLKLCKSESPKSIINNKGELLNNPIDTSNSSNNIFCSVVPNIPSTIKPNFKPFYHYLINPCVNSILIYPCTKKEILEIISNFDNNKATGINSIHLKILKLPKVPIAEHLCSIYNLSFTTRVFPGSLKTAKITTIYKKGSKNECSNYMPISLLYNLNKIIEKLMHKRLTEFLNDQKVLYKKQFGFKKNFSTAQLH